MFRKSVSGIVLTLLLLGVSALAFDVQPAKSEPRTWTVDDDGPADFHTIQEAINGADAGDTIYVRAGTYYGHVTLNKSLSLVGENRTSTILDGKQIHWPVEIKADHVIFSGFTVANSTGVYGWAGGGIYLVNSNHCIITDNIVINNQYGIALYGSSNNTIYNNLITENCANILVYGYPYYYSNFYENSSCNNNFVANVLTKGTGTAFELTSGNGNKLIGNIIANNSLGLLISEDCNNSKIYHNNFINNTRQVRIFSDTNIGLFSRNTWDDGYPSGGNYRSDYVGSDAYNGPYQNETGSDGIGDTPHVITMDNVDRYPLMAPIKAFNVIFWDGREYDIEILSNSTVANFQFNMSLIPEYPSTISFKVTGPELTGAFCRITIPNTIVQGFWNDKYTVLLNGEPWPFKNWTDGTYTYVYFIYQHPTHQVIIIPEFPLALILPLFMSLTMLALILKKENFA